MTLEAGSDVVLVRPDVRDEVLRVRWRDGPLTSQNAVCARVPYQRTAVIAALQELHYQGKARKGSMGWYTTTRPPSRPRRIEPPEATQHRRRRRSGLQISHKRAVESVVDMLVLEGYRKDVAWKMARAVMRRALSDRQRAKLDGRP